MADFAGGRVDLPRAVRAGLQIAAATYDAAKSRPRSPRAVRDEQLESVIVTVHEDNHGVYGVRNISAPWSQVNERRCWAGNVVNWEAMASGTAWAPQAPARSWPGVWRAPRSVAGAAAS